MATQVKQYPRNADGTPLDLEVAVYTDDTGNNGQRLTVPVTGPDGAPIDAKGVIPVDPQGNILPIPQIGAIMAIASFASASSVSVPLGTTMVNTNGYSAANDGGHGIYVADATVNAAYVTANPRTSFITTNNRGFRLSDTAQRLNLLMFGGKADCVGVGDAATGTDNLPAFVAAFNFIQTYAIVGFVNPGFFRGGSSLFVPRGSYRCSGALEPLYSGELYGEGGKGWGAATRIFFPRNTDAVRLQAQNTSGATTTDAGTHFAGDNLIISGIAFLGPYCTNDMLAADEGEFMGIRCKRVQHLYDCTFWGFQGDGYYAHATSGGGGTTEGNANVGRVHNCDFIGNRSGVSMDGGDANAIAFSSCSFMYNREHAIKDTGFLGNHHFGHHFDLNGRTAFNTGVAGRPVGFVTYLGNTFVAVYGQEGWCSVNAPPATATDNQGWIFWQVAGIALGIPTWFNGIAVRASGHILVSNVNNASTFYGCHAEGNATAQLDQRVYLAAGSTLSTLAFKVSAGVFQRDRLGSVYPIANGIAIGGNLTVAAALNVTGVSTLGPSNGTTANDGQTILASRNFSHFMNAQVFDSAGNAGSVYASIGWYSNFGLIFDTISGRIHRFRINAADIANVASDGFHVTAGVIDASGTVSGSNLNTSGFPTGVATGTIVGRSAAGTGAASALTTLPTAAMPALTGDITNSAGSLTTALGANVVTYAKFVQPAANSLVGNPTGSTANAQNIGLAGGLTFSGVNLTLGNITPTSVATAGAITSTGGVIGYATGAGGTVGQLTSKGTAVTLNKLSGEITLNAANLAADSTVTFQLNDSFLNANSILTINHASVGSFGSYNFNAHGFASGLCQVDVRNVTPGALAEAIVLRYAIGQAPTA